MYKGFESKFLTVCNHVLICLSMCQRVLFICTYCLLICVCRRTTCTRKFGATSYEHNPKFHVCPHTQCFWLTGSTASQPVRNTGPMGLLELNPPEFSACLLSVRKRLLTIHFFEDAEFMNHFPSTTKYLQGKIQPIWGVQIYFPLLITPLLAFPGVTDIPHHMARKHLWHCVIVFRM